VREHGFGGEGSPIQGRNMIRFAAADNRALRMRDRTESDTLAARKL
jgi:hypothetical protein